MRRAFFGVALAAGIAGGTVAHATELQGTVVNDLDQSSVVYVLDAGARVPLRAGASRVRQLGALDGAEVILQGSFDGAHRFVVDDAKPLVVKGVASGARALRLDATGESIAVHYTHGAIAPAEGRAVWAVAKFEGKRFSLEVRHWADADALRASR